MKTLFDLVNAAREKFENNPFIKEKTASGISEITFGEFYACALKIAAFLKDSFGKSVHSAVIGPTSGYYLMSHIGAMCGGNVSVPIDALLSVNDICELLTRADVDVLFYDKRYEQAIPAVKAACSSVKMFVALSGETENGLTVGAILDKYQPLVMSKEELPDENTLAAILFTSGTTGKAKGVMLSHGNFIDNAFCCDNESTDKDVLLTVLPIHHVYCFTCDILLSLRYGTTVCVNDSLMKVAQNLKLFAPTIILLVPMIAATICKQIKNAAKANPNIPVQAIAQSVFGGRLKIIYSGGTYLSPELISEYESFGITIAQGYGMTECSPRITSGDLSRKSNGDVGKIVRGCEVRIVDGEITVKSPSVMQGYYKDEKETAETVRGGWLYTGDLGYTDEYGRLYITGRKKNLIILSNGENVSPEELENKAEAFGIAQELIVYPEDEILTLELFLGSELYKDKTEEEAIAEVKAKVAEINKTLPSSKNIRRIRIRNEEFEKTTSRKIKRNQSRQGNII